MAQLSIHFPKSHCITYVVIVTNDMEDLKRVDEVSARYEEQSGMMLSRTEKSKVMFLGSWKWRAEVSFSSEILSFLEITQKLLRNFE